MKKNKLKILSITPHLGGGVGEVILNWIKSDQNNYHAVASLNYTMDRELEICFKNNIKLESDIYQRQETLLEMIKCSDIVILHYWNFPLLIDFLINTKLPKCRLIFYCHNSGRYAPYVIPNKMIDYSDLFILSTPISYDVDNIKNYNNFSKFKCITSTGGLNRYKDVKLRKHEDFNILHVGTLDYSKLSPDFIHICYEIIKNIPTAKFTICGEGKSVAIMQKQIRLLGIESNFNFTGWVSDLTPYLEIADVFLYPLNKKHYGTGEQILGIVLSVGLIPIVYGNPCERSIIEDCVNGFIISNKNDCVDVVELLRDDDKVKNYMSAECKKRSEEIYSIDKFLDQWQNVFNDIMKEEKKEREYNNEFESIYGLGTTAFLESLHKEQSELFHNYISYERQIKELFKSNEQWFSDNKGSVNQYLEFFPEDFYLNKFKNLLKEII